VIIRICISDDQVSLFPYVFVRSLASLRVSRKFATTADAVVLIFSGMAQLQGPAMGASHVPPCPLDEGLEANQKKMAHPANAEDWNNGKN